jgi:hypothetical protein
MDHQTLLDTRHDAEAHEGCAGIIRMTRRNEITWELIKGRWHTSWRVIDPCFGILDDKGFIWGFPNSDYDGSAMFALSPDDTDLPALYEAIIAQQIS